MINQQLFDNFDCKGTTKIKATSKIIQSALIVPFANYLDGLRKSTRGSKRTVDLQNFFKAFYAVTRDSVITSNLKDYCNITKSSYFRYLKKFQQSGLLDSAEVQALDSYTLIEPLMGDTFTVKSHDGSEGLGRNPTDRGRNGLKVQIIADTKGVIESMAIAPANKHDSKLLQDTLKENYYNKDILLDSAYTGKPIEKSCKACNLRPIVVPKKKRNGKKSHQLNPQDTQKLRSRWKIERVIGVLRKHRGISNKYTKSLKNYLLYLQFAVLTVICYHIFVI